MVIKMKSQNQRIFVMRHSERLDLVLGEHYKNSIKQIYEGDSKNLDANASFPLPRRHDGFDGYLCDTPLTKTGLYAAKLSGEVFKAYDTTIDHVYCSPSYRCVQTATALLEGMGHNNNVPIHVEPGIFEWTGFYDGFIPTFMTLDDLKTAGFNINDAHSPIVEASELGFEEDLETYYARSEKTMKEILSRHPEGNILIVGHGFTLDACTRSLIGHPPRTIDDIAYVCSFFAVLAKVELKKTENGWKMADSPLPSTSMIGHSMKRIDPKLLEQKDVEIPKDARKFVLWKMAKPSAR